MNYFLIILAGIFSLAPISAIAQDAGSATSGKKASRAIRFIFDSKSPPFAFREGNDTVGFDIDLGEAIGKELGVEVKWIDVPFDIRAYSNILEAGNADAALAAITITRIRKYFVDFTRPYFSTTLAVATRPEVKWDNRAFARGLENKIVGVMAGTTGEDWARKNLKSVIKTYNSPLSLVRSLRQGGNLAFAILIDDAILSYLRAHGTTDFKIVEKSFPQEGYGIAVSNSNFKLLAQLNAALESIEAEGEYDRIYNKWFEKK
ncbi:MAG: transporter substrate-binding domain-containing protein [Candidatus Euphemobacter frigidus]|nr:transporter substrate-binding domain-containing protein [Candidatus Euphemobacter frigidus]MDP8276456.1 transporter substrate-binding domain-containing protein [Candidatus Euphemobacter frigidus]